MILIDRALTCNDCGQDFIFTAGEQLFFLAKDFKNDPKRCKLCKARRFGRAISVATDHHAIRSVTETRLSCSTCAVETTVPFKPRHGRPVFCRQCFQVQQTGSRTATL